MAPTLWKGYITFGLVSIPIRLFAAARSEHTRFHEIHRESATRIRHQENRTLRRISSWATNLGQFAYTSLILANAVAPDVHSPRAQETNKTFAGFPRRGPCKSQSASWAHH